MKTLILVLGLLVSANSSADIYKCVTESGVTYSQSPCGAKSTVMKFKSPIIGSWLWNLDRVEFKQDGRGAYYRNGDVCYEFSYQYQADDLTITADGHHKCGAEIEAKYTAKISKNMLVMKHKGSGYTSTWHMQ